MRKALLAGLYSAYLKALRSSREYVHVLGNWIASFSSSYEPLPGALTRNSSQSTYDNNGTLITVESGHATIGDIPLFAKMRYTFNLIGHIPLSTWQLSAGATRTIHSDNDVTFTLPPGALVSLSQATTPTATYASAAQDTLIFSTDITIESGNSADLLMSHAITAAAVATGTLTGLTIATGTKTRLAVIITRGVLTTYRDGPQIKNNGAGTLTVRVTDPLLQNTTSTANIPSSYSGIYEFSNRTNGNTLLNGVVTESPGTLISPTGGLLLEPIGTNLIGLVTTLTKDTGIYDDTTAADNSTKDFVCYSAPSTSRVWKSILGTSTASPYTVHGLFKLTTSTDTTFQVGINAAASATPPTILANVTSAPGSTTASSFGDITITYTGLTVGVYYSYAITFQTVDTGPQVIYFRGGPADPNGSFGLSAPTLENSTFASSPIIGTTRQPTRYIKPLPLKIQGDICGIVRIKTCASSTSALGAGSLGISQLCNTNNPDTETLTLTQDGADPTLISLIHNSNEVTTTLSLAANEVTWLRDDIVTYRYRFNAATGALKLWVETPLGTIIKTGTATAANFTTLLKTQIIAGGAANSAQLDNAMIVQDIKTYNEVLTDIAIEAL